jgi:ABC-2 type transport system ATP-binding protein
MIVEVKNLVKKFGYVTAVDNLSFYMDNGDILGFVGPNGAGKTTTLRIMATLDMPTSGDVLVDGKSIVVRPEQAQNTVSFVPDALTVQKDISVHEYLDFFARLYGIKNPRRNRIVEEIEEFTNLTGIRYKLLTTLSKGMMQRVSIARALINEPKVILMDEPAAGLDPRARIELRELLKLLAQRNKTILISSHILSDLDEICTTALIVEMGRQLKFGKVKDIMAESEENLRVRRLTLTPIGSPDAVVNFLLQEPGVSQVNLLASTVEFDFDGSEEDASELLLKILTNGIKVVDFKVKRQNLESLFMDITKGELQ